MSNKLSNEGFSLLFRNARSHNGWLPEPVSDAVLRELYELLKWGPTSSNSCPARFVFVKSPEAKEKLLPCMAQGNMGKTRSAPVVTIIAQDMEFYEQFPKLTPKRDTRSDFVGKKELIESTAFRNSSLQGAYLMIAARGLGLDCGPMSGFDNKKVDDAFFSGTTWKSNFICGIGIGDTAKLYPRAPRLDFGEVCKII
jgi:3-hydroxypropanoate dehydrogenase